MRNQNYTERRIKVAGYDVDVVTYRRDAFYYPSFNGDREFPVTAKGFRALSSFLRTVRYFSNELSRFQQHYLTPEQP